MIHNFSYCNVELLHLSDLFLVHFCHISPIHAGSDNFNFTRSQAQIQFRRFQFHSDPCPYDNTLTAGDCLLFPRSSSLCNCNPVLPHLDSSIFNGIMTHTPEQSHPEFHPVSCDYLNSKIQLHHNGSRHRIISNESPSQLHFMNDKKRTMATIDNCPPADPDPHSTTTVTPPIKKSSKYTEWTRLNHKGIYHDNRRLLKHRAKNCECSVCYREIYKLPPMETRREYASSVKSKIEEQEKKKNQRIIKKEVKAGKQRLMEHFFRPY